MNCGMIMLIQSLACLCDHVDTVIGMSVWSCWYSHWHVCVVMLMQSLACLCGHVDAVIGMSVWSCWQSFAYLCDHVNTVIYIWVLVTSVNFYVSQLAFLSVLMSSFAYLCWWVQFHIQVELICSPVLTTLFARVSVDWSISMAWYRLSCITSRICHFLYWLCAIHNSCICVPGLPLCKILYDNNNIVASLVLMCHGWLGITNQR